MGSTAHRQLVTRLGAEAAPGLGDDRRVALVVPDSVLIVRVNFNTSLTENLPNFIGTAGSAFLNLIDVYFSTMVCTFSSIARARSAWIKPNPLSKSNLGGPMSMAVSSRITSNSRPQPRDHARCRGGP
jgi:hypothetical protein